MTIIKIIANGASVSAIVDGELTSGMVGIPVEIEYDNAWNGLTKTASFRVGSFVRSRENIETTTTVPWEVMRHSGKVLQVGVEGRDKDGNIVMPTVWASCGTIKDGAVSGIPGAPNPVTDIPSGGVGIDDSAISSESTWSSQNIVNKLCPSFTESGTVVACEPLEGYPLEVISEIPYAEGTSLESVSLTRLGANLIPQPYQKGTFTANGITFTVNDDYSITLDGTATVTSTFLFLGSGAGLNAQKAADAGFFVGETYTMSLGTALPNGATLYFCSYDESGTQITPTYAVTQAYKSFTINSGTAYVYVFLHIQPNVVFDNLTVYPMIQHGSAATEYEPYTKLTYTADFSDYDSTDVEGSYNWTTGVLVDNFAETEVQRNPQHMPAFSGINTFVSRVDASGDIVTSNTTVKGKKDPVKVIENLTNAIIALGGNI